MPAPIPSFLKMCRFIVLVLVFLVIGFSNQVFASSLCAPFSISWPAGSQPNREFEVFDTFAEAQDYCHSFGGNYAECHPGSPILSCVEQYGYSICWHNDPSDQYFGASCTICQEEKAQAEEECSGSANVTWDDPSTCSYSCLCPGYAGQQGYDFDTCTAPEGGDPCEEAYQQAVTDCGGTEQVITDSAENCKFHCDQGECEDEYQAALQQCSNPQLLDSLTCEYSCACDTARAEAEQNCPGGYYLSPTDCQYACKCCPEKEQECRDYCGEGNINNYSCSNKSIPSTASTAGGCSIDPATYVPCECIEPPDDNPGPQDPVPNPGEGEEPPSSCADFESDCRAAGCTPSCSENSAGEIVSKNCDCNSDPADPGPDGQSGTEDDGEAGSADDGANGWLKEIEDNTDRTANETDEGNRWLGTLKDNSDVAIENDEFYFSDETGTAYLETLNDSADITNDQLFEIADALNFVDLEGESTVPFDTNTYLKNSDPIVSGEIDSVVSGGIASVSSDDKLSQVLSDYIATGIPLVQYIQNSSINLSASTPQLSMTFWGKPVVVDFSQYTAIVDIAGNILLGLTVISSIMMIVTRVKG